MSWHCMSTFVHVVVHSLRNARVLKALQRRAGHALFSQQAQHECLIIDANQHERNSLFKLCG